MLINTRNKQFLVFIGCLLLSFIAGMLFCTTKNVATENDLYAIGIKHKSDKIHHHGYYRFYSMFLPRNIDSILEIGIADKHSLPLWLEYFPTAFVYGIDINLAETGTRYKVFKADQSNLQNLIAVRQQINKPVNVIIDDGSHIPEHQILSFAYLFANLLSDGGVYIIEDIECGYWKRGDIYNYKTSYGPFNAMNLVNIFNHIIHLLNREYISAADQASINNMLPTYIDIALINSISTITFGQNCIIIKKKTPHEYKFVNRKYRYAENL